MIINIGHKKDRGRREAKSATIWGLTRLLNQAI